MDIAIGVTALNVALLLLLLYPYVRNALKTRSNMAFGLVLFAAFFLLQNLISLYFYATNMMYYVGPVEPDVMVLGIIEFVGISFFLWVTYT
jgi:chromate transport protein ChrA